MRAAFPSMLSMRGQSGNTRCALISAMPAYLYGSWTTQFREENEAASGLWARVLVVGKIPKLVIHELRFILTCSESPLWSFSPKQREEVCV